jgi:hypothetical protein
MGGCVGRQRIHGVIGLQALRMQAHARIFISAARRDLSQRFKQVLIDAGKLSPSAVF